MSFRHRYQQGDNFPALVLCTDGSGVPVAPTEAPTADFWTGGALVLTKQLPCLDSGAVVGLFGMPVFLGAPFAPGSYSVVYLWRTASSNGLIVDSFEVVPGGSPEGAVLSMFELVRPQARYILQQTDAGKIKRGRNPRM